MGPTKRGKGSKILALASRSGAPCGIAVTSASPAEVTLVHEVLAHRFTRRLPDRLLGDRAYDSDPLDAELRRRGIDMIASHREGRVAPPTQDGRSRRRLQRRWKVERLFSWRYNFRRLVVRWEYHVANFLAFVQLGCIVILLRQDL